MVGRHAGRAAGEADRRRNNLKELVPGVLYEARERDFTREPELVELTFVSRGTALVPG